MQSKTASKPWLIKMLHIGKSQLHMADESYRALLAHHGNGKKSSKQLTVTELQSVFDAMVKLGFNVVSKPVKAGSNKRYSPSSKVAPDERSVIRAVWIFMAKNSFIRDGSETALNSWVKRMTAEQNGGDGIAEVQWLQGADAFKVLEALKRWCRRCLFDGLKAAGHEVYPQASYQILLDKWQRVHGEKP